MANPKVGGKPTVMVEKCGQMTFTEQERIICGLHVALRSIGGALSEAATEHGLSGMEANFILKMNHGLSSPTKIAAFLGVDPSSLSRMMRKLESSGLMTRKGDPINRSRVNVALTSKGKKKAASMEPSIRRVEEEVFSELNDKELRELRKLLQKVCVSLMEKNE